MTTDIKLKELVKQAEDSISELFNNINLMKNYLDILHRNDGLTYYAATMLNKDATYVDTYEGWKERGYQVKAGEHGTAVFQKRKQVRNRFIDDYGRVRDISTATFIEKQKIQNGDLKLNSGLSSYYVIEYVFDQKQTTAENINLSVSKPESNLSFDDIKNVIRESINDMLLEDDDFILPDSTLLCARAYATYLFCINQNISGERDDLFLQSIKDVTDSKIRLSLSDMKLVLNSVIKVVTSERTFKVLKERKEEIANEALNANKVIIDGNACIKIDEWQNGTGRYILAQSLNDDSFFYVNVKDSNVNWEGSYNYEFDHEPSRSEIEEIHLNKIADNDIDKHEEIYGADGEIAFPNLNDDKNKYSPQSQLEKSKNKIEDFGKKIGGARKDLWRQRGLMPDDLSDMNLAEKNKYATKNNIFKKPDYQQMVNDGLPVRTAYFIKTVRDALPAKPVFDYFEKDNEELAEKKIVGYVEFISEFKNALLNVKTDEDILSFYDDVIKDVYVKNESTYRVVPTEKSHGCITNKLLRACQVSRFGLSEFDRKIKRKQFCYSEHDKKINGFEIEKFDESCEFDNDRGRTILKKKMGNGTYFFYPDGELADSSKWIKGTCYVLYKGHIVANNLSMEQAKVTVEKMADGFAAIKSNGKAAEKKKRKIKFVPKQLKHIERTGPSNGINEYNHADGQLYLDTFGFAGGEFGNWMNENDRQASLDYGYDALMDLADALAIEPKDISFGGELSIAFGSRGVSGAAAHYEPLRQVINLTKMHGAGSLAHEWGHAFDNILSKKSGMNGIDTWLTDKRKNTMLSSVKELMHTIKYRPASSEERQAEWDKLCNIYKDNFYYSLKSNIDNEDLVNDFRLKSSNLMRDERCNEEKVKELILSLSDKYEKISGQSLHSSYQKLLVEEFIEVNKKYTMPVEEMKCPDVKTDFYKNSIKFDSLYSKEAKGYWQSDKELFARAFACYIKDKLPYKSDYLCGHAESAVTLSHDKTLIKAYPTGKEREAINKCFDNVIQQVKDLGLIHQQENQQKRKCR